MSLTLSSVFSGANGGITGAVITAWKVTRFGTAPEETSAPPSGTPDGGPVASSVTFGCAGAWHLTVTAVTTYWVSAVINNIRYWALYPVNGTTAVSMGGDVTGTSTAATVVKLLNRTLSTNVPSNSWAYCWTLGQEKWVPRSVLRTLVSTTLSTTVSTTGQYLVNVTKAPSSALVAGTNITLATTAGKAKINATATTKVTLAGDVTGTSTANTVTKIRGRNVATTTPTVHMVYAYTLGGTSWVPVHPSTLLVAGTRVTITTTSGKAKVTANVQTTTSVTMGGDVTGSSTAATVGKLRGRTLSTNTPTNSWAYCWTLGATKWVPRSVLRTIVSTTLSHTIGTTGQYVVNVTKAPATALVAGTGITLGTTAGKALISTTTIPAVAHNTGSTLVLTDAGKLITVTNAAGKTITIPKAATVAFATGTVIGISQTGAGQVTVAAGSTVTLHSHTAKFHTAAQYAVVWLRKMATNTWRLYGDIA